MCSYVGPGVGIAVRVGRRHNMEVIRVQECCRTVVGAISRGELIQNVLAGGRTDPFTGMDPTVDPDDWFAPGIGGNL